MAIPVTSTVLIAVVITLSTVAHLTESSSDNNRIFSPCADATVEKSDGFTLGIAFASRSAFFFNKSVQLSPCDRRLSLSSANSQLSVFRPKVDEISLLTVNSSSFSPLLRFRWRDGHGKPNENG
ncbi:putative diphthamide biosynthesis protein [Helianthus annuus]|nr:putative diphthamide biosynthesis protein [Helianthus annuus]